MRFDRWTVVALVGVSFIAGYVTGDRHLREHYKLITDAEIMDVKDHYEARTKKAVEEAIKEYDQWVGEPSTNEQAFHTAVSEFATSLVPTPEPEHVVGITDVLVPVQIQQEQDQRYQDARHALVNYQVGEAGAYLEKRPIVPEEPANLPFVISQTFFMAAEDNYSQYTLLYYEGDNVLSNAAGEEISGVERELWVGDCVTKFGEHSEDPNVVYVRSPHYHMDFEVVRNLGKYSVEVLGVGEESQ